jgi:apolipoprotein N-acyltransferase
VVLPALAGGVCFGLAWLPLGLGPLVPLAIAAALYGLRSCRDGRDAALFGLLFAAARYAVGGHVVLALVSYSWLAVVLYLLALVFVLPYGLLLEGLGPLWLERWSGLPRTVGFLALFTIGEALRTVGDLSFPADILAHGLGGQPAWLGWNPWGGPYLTTFLAIVAGLLLEEAWRRRRRLGRTFALAGLAAALWLAPALTWWLTAPPAGGAEGPSLKVGLVQPCLDVRDKADPARHPELWARLTALTREAAAGADLVVWPESARPGPVIWRDGEPFADPEVEALARETGTPILYGCEIARVAGRRVQALYNGAALVHPDGQPAQWYGKQRLLPFVEGVPFAGLLGWDPSDREPGEKRSLLTMVGNFSPGPRATLFEVGPARIGVLICYESLYPHLVRRYRQAGANALCVITNDAWWGRSLFPSWHARMVAARALEADLPVVRAANSGLSTHTDAAGRITASTQLDAVTTLHVELTPHRSGPTPYAITGNLLVWALLGLVGGALAAGAWRRLAVARTEAESTS